MSIFKTVAELRSYLYSKRAGKIALVPTMGALHAGHLELIRRAVEQADHVVVSIFVNPTQFGPNEDFEAYPRDLQKDSEFIGSLGTNKITIFAPEVHEVYPSPSTTQMILGDIAARWEGALRPIHFGGVALVVSKLFHIVQPNVACFGEKDFQQLQIIRQMVRDLSFPIDIIGVPIVREPSGLARSSRNTYLSPEHRNVAAPKLFAVLQVAAKEIHADAKVEIVLASAKQKLLEAGFSDIDYLAYVDSQTLTPQIHRVMQPARIIVAAKLGTTRLIDNVPVA